MDLQFALPVPGRAAAGLPAPAFRVADVVLKHLKGEAQVASVLHLRDEIDLSVHKNGAAAGPQFDALEKKETSAGLSTVSSWTAS